MSPMWIADLEHPHDRRAGDQGPRDHGCCAASRNDVEERKAFDAKEFHAGQVEDQASAVGAVPKHIPHETIGVRRVDLSGHADADHGPAVPFSAQKHSLACDFSGGWQLNLMCQAYPGAPAGEEPARQDSGLGDAEAVEYGGHPDLPPSL